MAKERQLHLGCGRNYLEEFTNVELPQNKHFKADLYADLNDLKFKNGSIDKIVISHVFEHFDRVTALSLLIKWNQWLSIDGVLIITVPDFMTNVQAIISDHKDNFKCQQLLMRHIFGSHEADWAIHKDGWYLDKFMHVIPQFGFTISESRLMAIKSAPIRYDIQIEAVKTLDIPLQMAVKNALEVLNDSLFGGEDFISQFWKNKLYFLTQYSPENETEQSQKSNKIRKETVMLVFSKNRAMQLDCTLRTFFKKCLDNDQIDVSVLYKCSNPANEDQYSRLKDLFPKVDFFEETNFRDNVLYILSGYKYVLMCVDDTIFTNPFKVDDALEVLKDESVIGFSLRLGSNIKYSYMTDMEQIAPNFNPHEYSDNIQVFNWTDQMGDFAYPLELSSSIYRTDDIYNIAMRINWGCPNALEYCLDSFKSVISDKHMLGCYNTSVAFANPVNSVQTYCSGNKFGNISCEFLSDKFYKGYRIDTLPFHGLVSNSCHQEVAFKFIHGRFNNQNPTMSIVIPTYNGVEHLKKCLYSIIRNTNNDYEIIVIDNKREPIVDFINDEFPEIVLIENETNIGVSLARNQGLSLSNGRYIVCLDDDTVVTRNWDSKFIRYFDALSTLGIIGPKSNWASGPQLVKEGEYSNIPELESFAQTFDKNTGRLTKTKRLVGFCLFMRREVIEKIGGFDGSMMCGFDDDDFTLRAYLANFYPVVANDIFIHHTGGPTKDMNPEYIKMVNDGWASFKSKWGLSEDLSRDDGYSVPLEYNKFVDSEHYIPLTSPIKKVAA